MVGKIISGTYDIIKGVNATVWGGVESSRKVVKIGLSGADTVIGVSHALEDFSCNDHICRSLDVVGSVSSAVGMVLGNISITKHLIVVTGSVTFGCRTVRYYCKHYVTFWGCTITTGQVIKYAVKFTMKN